MATPDHAAASDSERWSEQTLDEIYDLRGPAEEAFHRSLGEDERAIFRLFAIGTKLSHQKRHQNIPTQGTIIKAWQTTDDIDREPGISLAQGQPDPRLNHANFLINPGLLYNFYTALPQAEQSNFEAFVFGCKVSNPEFREPHWHQSIVDIWVHRDVAFKDPIMARGRRHHIRFLTQPILRQTNASSGHWWVRTKPDAKMGDVKFTNAVLHPRSPDEPVRPAGSRWVFERTIYQNQHVEVVPNKLWTQRIVHLFALISEDRQILKKRMVVKIIGRLTVRQAEDEISTEFRFQNTLSFRNCASILDAYGSAIRERAAPPQLGYIYMDYAEFGDLLRLVTRLEREPNKQLPEPYLWLIFRALAEALLLMETGMAIEKDAPTHENGQIHQQFDWRPIINPDIKPMNVMLSEARDDFYPAFKTTKMIDFGLCFDDNRYDTEATKRAVGTPGYWPPEQMDPPHPEYADEPIDIASEIFNVGLIMLSLMEGRSRIVSDKELRDQGFTHSDDYEKCYSTFLNDLICDCLEFAPWDRPNLPILLYRTRVGLERWEKVYGSADRPGAELPDFATFHFDREEEFLIGEEAPDHWLGMKARKKRKAEEAGLTPAGPAEKKHRAEHPLPPAIAPLPGRDWMNYGQLQPPAPPLPHPQVGLGPNIQPVQEGFANRVGRREMQQPLPLPRDPQWPPGGFPAGLVDRLPPANQYPHMHGLGQPNDPPIPGKVPGGFNFPNLAVQPAHVGFRPANWPPYLQQDNLALVDQAAQYYFPRPVSDHWPHGMPRLVQQPQYPQGNQVDRATQQERFQVHQDWVEEKNQRVDRSSPFRLADAGKYKNKLCVQEQPQPPLDSAKENETPGKKEKSSTAFSNGSSRLSSAKTIETP